MAGQYETITELLRTTIQGIAGHPDRYLSYLRTAAFNYRQTVSNQALIYTQRPEAKNCGEIGYWNSRGRVVPRSAVGITIFSDKNPQKLRTVFDYAQTIAQDRQPSPVWEIQPNEIPELMESLANRYGLNNPDGAELADFLLSLAANLAEDELPDYLEMLEVAKTGSLLEDLDEDNLRVWLREMLEHSIGYTLLTRCGLNATLYYELSDFQRIADFDTTAAFAVLGTAVNEVSAAVLREIGTTVYSLRREAARENRTFANQPAQAHNDSRPKNQEGSERDETGISSGRRLSDSQPDSPTGTENREIWDASADFPTPAPQRDLSGAVDGGYSEQPFGGDRQAGQEDGGQPDFSDGQDRGRDGEPESNRSDVVGTEDEQHPAEGGGNRDARSHLELAQYDLFAPSGIPYYHYDEEKQELIRNSDVLKDHRREIAAFFASHEDSTERGNFIAGFFSNTLTESILSNEQRAGYRAFRQGLHLFRGSYTSPEMEENLRWNAVANVVYGMILTAEWLSPEEQPLPSEGEQISLLEERQKRGTGSFSLPQEAIDYVLINLRSTASDKLEIYEKYQNQATRKERISLIKSLYGYLGHSQAIPGTGYFLQVKPEKGVTIRRTVNSENEQIVLSWTSVEKRIGELIEADRYLNCAEKKEYAAIQRDKQPKDARFQTAREFQSEIKDFNDYQASKKEYVLSEGDTVILGSEEKEILSINSETVKLASVQFPLLQQELSYADFISQVIQSHANDRYQQEVEEIPSEEKVYDLGYGYLGNGLTVWNRAETVRGDYKTIAHIDPNRTVTFYEELPESVKAKIQNVADTSETTISATQDAPVFAVPPPHREQEQAQESPPVEAGKRTDPGVLCGGV